MTEIFSITTQIALALIVLMVGVLMKRQEKSLVGQVEIKSDLKGLRDSHNSHILSDDKHFADIRDNFKEVFGEQKIQGKAIASIKGTA